MAPYKSAFEVGDMVRVRSRRELEKFKSDWKFHNPLRDDQLESGGSLAAVESVGFYHGGDVLYRLSDVPGIWHEQCLESPGGGAG